jgi:Flp pilus assembly protein TadD
MSRRDWLFGLALFGITFLVYAPAWHGQPIWDDEIHITRPELRSLHGLVRIWSDPAAAPQYYPVLHTLFWLEYKMWDGSVLPYHLVTIFFHALLAVLVMLILRRLNLPGAWLAAFVFALHPVNVESVAWLSEIKNTMSGALAAAAMLAYLRYDQDRSVSRPIGSRFVEPAGSPSSFNAIAMDKDIVTAEGAARHRRVRRHPLAFLTALAFFAAALLAKTAVVALPIVLLVVFWWKRGSVRWQRDLRPLLPFFMLAVAAGIVTVWVEQKFCAEHGETFNFSFIDRCLAAGRLFWFYLGKIFWPTNLCLIYPRWMIDSAQWWQYTFALGGIALFVGLWLLRRKTRAPLAAFLCFVAILFPVLGFFNLSFFMTTPPSIPHSAIFRADHFQYLADIPIIALLCAGAAWLWERTGGAARSVLSVVCILVVASLALLTSAQSRTYRDTETCFREVLSKNPESATAHNNLANVLRQKGALDEAIIHYRRALDSEPDYQFGRLNLGSALAEHGDFAEAIGWLRAALKTDPNNAKAYYMLANALSKRGEPNEAIAYYGRALKLEPDFADAHCNLANLLLEKGDTENALLHYREALRLEPNNPAAHYNLAVGLVHKGEIDPAIAELRTALQIDPAYPDAGPLLNDLLARKEQR